MFNAILRSIILYHFTQIFELKNCLCLFIFLQEWTRIKEDAELVPEKPFKKEPMHVPVYFTLSMACITLIYETKEDITYHYSTSIGAVSSFEMLSNRFRGRSCCVSFQVHRKGQLKGKLSVEIIVYWELIFVYALVIFGYMSSGRNC